MSASTLSEFTLFVLPLKQQRKRERYRMNDGQKKAAIATSIIVSALFFTLTTLQGNKTQREIRQLQKEIKGGGTSGITG